MARKVSAKTYRKYQREILKLCLEFLVLSVTLAGGIFFVDSQKKQAAQVLGASSVVRQELSLTPEEKCIADWKKNCSNPSINYCVRLVRECKDIVDFSTLE